MIEKIPRECFPANETEMVAERRSPKLFDERCADLARWRRKKQPKPDISAAAVDDRDAQILAEPLNPLELEEALATDDDNRLTSDWNIIELAAEKWLSAEQVILSAPDGTAALNVETDVGEDLGPEISEAEGKGRLEAYADGFSVGRKAVQDGTAALREALRPFADVARGIPDDPHDVAPACRVDQDAKHPGTFTTINNASFRRAREAYDAALSSPAPSPWQGKARPLADWHEDDGPVLWWKFPIDEAPWVGQPGDSDWFGYHTHWTPLPPPPELTEKAK